MSNNSESEHRAHGVDRAGREHSNTNVQQKASATARWARVLLRRPRHWREQQQHHELAAAVAKTIKYKDKKKKPHTHCGLAIADTGKQVMCERNSINHSTCCIIWQRLIRSQHNKGVPKRDLQGGID